MKKLLALVLALALAMSMAAFSYAEEEEMTFKTLYASEISTLNYLTTATTNDFGLLANVIDTLVEYDNYSVLQPALAESWTVSDDGLVWTFNLRKDATWVNSKGEFVANVTANDFVASAKYILNQANASSTADLITSYIAGAQEYYDSTATDAVLDFDTVGVKAVDDYTLEYTLYAPCAYFLSTLVYVNYMPVYEPFLLEKGEDFGVINDVDNILYCGAYILEELNPDQNRRLVKNESNWDADKVYITTIDFICNKEAGSISAEMYRRGEIDSADIDNTTAAQWLKDPETENLIHPARQDGQYSYFFCFDYDPKFDDEYEPENWKIAVNNEAFRQSIFWGLDRVKAKSATEPDVPESLLFNTITPPGFANVNGIDFTQMEGLKTWSDLGTDIFNEEKALAYRDQAKEELIAAGATLPVKVYMRYKPDGSSWDSECQIIEQQLEELLGADYIDIIIEAGPVDNFLSLTRRNGDYGVQRCNWGADYMDPYTFADPFESGDNYCFFDACLDTETIAAYHALVAEGKAETTDLAKRYSLFAQAEALLIEHALIIPYGFGDGGYTASRIDPFSCQFASFGVSNERYKGAKLLDEPMSTDAYYDALDAWEEERANLAK